MVTEVQEHIAGQVLNCAFEVHSHLGPGLLESTYQTCLLNDLHLAQILSYMRLANISLGFLFNFNVRHFKDGFKRVVLQRS
ncbi:MAG: GxxExxY protein [Treponema sp.]|jgi:hypothetical protein|nr:GxxExxY protein [Treponema sp.]